MEMMTGIIAISQNTQTRPTIATNKTMEWTAMKRNHIEMIAMNHENIPIINKIMRPNTHHTEKTIERNQKKIVVQLT
jgi:hypothetical protein